MSNEQVQELFSSLKKLGMELEFELNEFIKNQLNKEEILLAASSNSAIIAQCINQCRDITELLSIPLNFPTKNDVANVAKLSIQIEEKVDQLEEQIASLSKALDEIQGSLNTYELPSNREKPEQSPGTRPQSMEDKAASLAEKRKKIRARTVGILLDNLQDSYALQGGRTLGRKEKNGG
jgi:hypothetical protein